MKLKTLCQQMQQRYSDKKSMIKFSDILTQWGYSENEVLAIIKDVYENDTSNLQLPNDLIQKIVEEFNLDNYEKENEVKNRIIKIMYKLDQRRNEDE